MTDCIVAVSSKAPLHQKLPYEGQVVRTAGWCAGWFTAAGLSLRFRVLFGR
jgi:hypothetical protein